MKIHCERLSALMLATVLAIGVLVAWYLVTATLIGPLWYKFFRSRSGSEQLQVLGDATPVIVSSIFSSQTTRYSTLDGVTLPVDKTTGKLRRGDFLFGPEDEKTFLWRGDWWHRIIPLHLSTPYPASAPNEQWYLMYNGCLDGRLYFVGYDPVTCLWVGYIGRNGFSRRQPSEEEQFRVDGRFMVDARRRVFALQGRLFPADESRPDAELTATTILYLLTDDGVYEIAFHRRTATMYYQNKHVCSLASTMASAYLEDIHRDVSAIDMLAVRTPDRVILMNSKGKIERFYTLPPEIRNQDFFWYNLGDGKAALTVDQRGLQMHVTPNEPKAALIYWFDDDGKVVDHREVALKTTKGTSDAVVNMLCFPSPIMQCIQCFDLRYREGYFESLSKKIADEWPWLTVLAVVCVVLAWLCYRRQRGYGMPWTWMWVIFVLLLGVPGWLGYLAHRRRPTRLPCPNCDEPSPRDRPACIYCGQDFPAPAPTGTEVFA